MVDTNWAFVVLHIGLVGYSFNAFSIGSLFWSPKRSRFYYSLGCTIFKGVQILLACPFWVCCWTVYCLGSWHFDAFTSASTSVSGMCAQDFTNFLVHFCSITLSTEVRHLWIWWGIDSQYQYVPSYIFKCLYPYTIPLQYPT